MEKLVSEKVKAAQKDIKLKGFRKGKAPWRECLIYMAQKSDKRLYLI